MKSGPKNKTATIKHVYIWTVKAVFENYAKYSDIWIEDKKIYIVKLMRDFKITIDIVKKSN